MRVRDDIEHQRLEPRSGPAAAATEVVAGTETNAIRAAIEALATKLFMITLVWFQTISLEGLSGP
jgi:hypothetical protein